MLSKYPGIFIQIPRNGCGSINAILQQTGGHRPASYYKQKFPTEWEQRITFAVVREDREASILRHFGEWPAHIHEQEWYLDEPVDVLLRFEHLAEDFAELAVRLGITEPLPHLNRSI